MTAVHTIPAHITKPKRLRPYSRPELYLVSINTPDAKGEFVINRETAETLFGLMQEQIVRSQDPRQLACAIQIIPPTKASDRSSLREWKTIVQTAKANRRSTGCL